MAKNKDYFDLTYDSIKARTAKAILFDFGDEERWVPISLIDPDSMPLEEEGGEVGIEFWFIKQEEIEAYAS